jgi:hypothetical protein
MPLRRNTSAPNHSSGSIPNIDRRLPTQQEAFCSVLIQIFLENRTGLYAQDKKIPAAFPQPGQVWE